MKPSFVLPILLFSLIEAAAAADSLAVQPQWDVTAARGETRRIDFTTDEGTWMSVDVSPDGRWIVFDLLAHIYRVPVEGGEAESLTQASGVALNFQPRYSPDGRTIAFISDRGGQNNLWVMNADGSEPRPVFTNLEVRAFEPVWTPDGKSILVRQQQGERWASHSCETLRCQIWKYPRDGGQGVPLTDAKIQAGWPSVSPDGRFVYFYEWMGGRELLTGIYQLRRLDLQTKDVAEVTSGKIGYRWGSASGGDAYAPEVSPDGRWLAFARRMPFGRISFKGHEYGPRTALWLRDLRTGEERPLMDPIEQDMSEDFGTAKILPAYHWTRDARWIVLSQGGKLRRVEVASGRIETIPFKARVQRTISQQAFAPLEIADDEFPVRFLRWATTSPDGKHLTFQAVGRNWIMDLPHGKPRRLTSASFGASEFAPAWSPDGRWVVFTSWDDVEGGHVWRVPARGGQPRRLTVEPGEYLNPAWSLDGRQLVMLRGAGVTRRHRGLFHNPWYEIVTMPVAGGPARAVSRIGQPGYRRQLPRPVFGPGGRIYFPQRLTESKGTPFALVSILNDGSDRREHMTFPYADEIVPSPDGKWVAFNEGDNIYMTPFPSQTTGAPAVPVDKASSHASVETLSREGGLFPWWRDAKTLEFASGARYFAHHIDTGRTESVDIDLRLPRARAQGTVALRGARLITLEDRKVIEGGTLVVRNGRILCVGAAGTCDVSGVRRVIDVAGKTIIPGLIDMHAHLHYDFRGIVPRHAQTPAIYLAYGVTSLMDPSPWSQDFFPAAESIEAGELTGPRSFSTGEPLYMGDGARQNDLKSYDVTDREITRLKSWGATSIKQYLQPRREQRQWISDVARKRGLMVTAEGGGSDITYMLGMIMDGHTGWEHALNEMPIYSDVARFMGQANAVYSATLGVSPTYPSWNIEYFLAKRDLRDNDKLLLWKPWQELAPLLQRRVLAPEASYNFPLLAQGMADIIAAGGHATIGGHGEMQGLGTHWELWMAASALGPMGALEVASRQGAYFLGLEHETGSLKAGKLADLVILDANPLENIRNTASIRYVMKDGRLYDGTTLDEIWPQARPYGPRPWRDPDSLRDDVLPIDLLSDPSATPPSP